MNVTVIDTVIRSLCAEVSTMDGSPQDWHLLSEEDLLYEVSVCIFGSQMVFEVAVATADRLRQTGFFRPTRHKFNQPEYERSIVAALSEALSLSSENGEVRQVRPRFKNRHAYLLATTVTEIYGRGWSLQDMLSAACSAKEARKTLVQHVCGFGPKQASLFLRRVGYSSDFAVLDTHVMDYLSLFRGLSFKARNLAQLSLYEQIEDEFRIIADEFGYSLGCVDLATWVTMRVAKQESKL